MVSRDCIRNAAGLRQDIFFALLYENLINDPYDFSRAGVIERAAAVAGISRRIQLKDIVRILQSIE